MEMIDVIQQVIQESMKGAQLCDMEIGTVTAAKPLEISINNMQQPLKQQVLYLTENVIEKKIPLLKHIHHINTLTHNHAGGVDALTDSYPTLESLLSQGATSDQTQNIICYEHGEPLPAKDGFIILNRALEVGDKVLLLSVQSGQKYIILSRIFAFEG